MNTKFLYIFFVGVVFILMGSANAQEVQDTVKLPFKIESQDNNPFAPKKASSNINFKDPSNLKTEVEYDLERNQYLIHKKSGTVDYAVPYTLSFDDYVNYDVQKSLKKYWRERYRSETFENQSSIIPKINIGSEAFETIFGSNTIDIKPSGMASLKFGIKIDYTENPNQAVELRRNTTFDFKEDIQMSVVGKIGDNLEMRVNYDTESQFDFDNTMKLAYQGKEDDIIQKIEAGDVSLPLATSLITGSQSLFGVLTELKFGKLYISSVFSQQEGETKTITVEGGAQKSEFNFSAAEYDRNRHFFLSHYFRQKYDEALNNVNQPKSSVVITNIEVWVTNKTGSTENGRNIVAMLDLAEQTKTYELYGRDEKAVYDENLIMNGYNYPENGANNLYETTVNAIEQGTGEDFRSVNNITQWFQNENLESGVDYEKVEFAERLQEGRDYRVNKQLGYISLNSAITDDKVLAVAYEYSVNGETYKVGELSQEIESPKVLVVKLLKGTNFSPNLPNWDLMMKNVYSIGGYQLNKEGFVFDVEFYNDSKGTRVLNVPVPSAYNSALSADNRLKKDKFIRLLNLDYLNASGDYVEIGDGVFDYVDGTTILSSNGRVIFPVVEPFGGYLNQLIKNEVAGEKPDVVAAISDMADDITYQELYDSTQFKAEQVTSKNKYYLVGEYKSAGGSEIFLNAFNIPEGSVKVTAGGMQLTENQDYTVDYNLGRVKILNESFLASGTPIKISLESNSLFSIQSKTLMGTHMEYRFNSDFNLGATAMKLSERPLTEKVNTGEEPINNTIWGLNGSYRTEVPFLTKAVDFLPFIETKEKSTITLEGEFAQLIPGHNKAIGETGEAFIDDFEGSESSIVLDQQYRWVLASTPQGQPKLFPEADNFTDKSYGYNRAKLAWYGIDPSFFNSGSPVNTDVQSKLTVYRVNEQDLFPNKETQNGIPTEITTFDMAFYPDEKGPYNFDVDENPGISMGIDPQTGKLNNPETRWGGIMSELTTNDFEAQNIEYIRFWMMDPFVEEFADNEGGDLYFNLGNVSEDILKDGRKSYEHGLPTTENPDPKEYRVTQWGRVPAFQAITNDFVSGYQGVQDVGLDGISTTVEQTFFADYIDALSAYVTNPDVLDKLASDPSTDDFVYWDDDTFNEETSILERYKNFNNQEGNTPDASKSTQRGKADPDVEDINGDYTLSETEAYFQYAIHLSKNDLVEGRNYISDKRTTTVNFNNGTKTEVNWYQFKIPINEGQAIGNIQDFKSIRFARIFLTGWEKPIVLRFADMELVRSEWRKYEYAIKEGGENLGGGSESFDPNDIPFSVSSVNIEENGDRSPVNYVLPPGVDRQQDPSNPQLVQLNEQSMALRVLDLKDGYSKAVYKTINMDMRDYGKIKMFIHAEAIPELTDLNNKDIRCFVRLGTDFTDNFYEYEVPLMVTSAGQNSRDSVWPAQNNMEIVLSDLVDAKLARNDAMRRDGSAVSFTDLYAYYADGRRIIIKGNPNIAEVKTIMVGIRNPKAQYNQNYDDGLPKSAEIWVNELRLTDFNEKGGWAATGRMTARLADLGTVSVAGSTTQPGFGSIEQKAQERAKEETNQVDVNVNVELGKFFPKEANVRLPMFVGYSRTAINPEFDPLDKDVKLEDFLNNPNVTQQEKEQRLAQVQDLTERRSINFTNVGVGKLGKGKTRFYSPSNLSATYSYSELTHHDIGIEHDNQKDILGSLNYIYNNRPKNIQPLKKSKFFKKKALKLIGDFNFYYAPQQVSLRTTMNRSYGETLLRNLNNPDQIFTETYNKSFTWSRQFDLKYNLSKSLKFDFSTNTNALINETEGKVDRDDKENFEIFKDSVWHSIKGLGTPNTYSQKFNASYTIPINKIPLLDWVSSNARYTGTYNWDRARDTKDNLNVGNKIKNSQQISLSNQFRMDNLYNKLGFLEKINKKYKQSRKQRKKPRFERASFTKERMRFKGGTARRITHGLDTEEDIEVKVKTASGTEVKSTFEIINPNRVSVLLERDAEDVVVEISGKKQIKDNPFKQAYEYTSLALMGFKQFSINYSLTQGTVFGNYSQEHQFDRLPTEPGLAFIMGWQQRNFGEKMANSGFMSSDTSVVEPYLMTSNETYNFKANYQPIKSIRIDFTAKRGYSNNIQEYYFKNDQEQFVANDYQASGSYDFSFWMLGTAFSKRPSIENPESEVFMAYRQALIDQAWKLANSRERGGANFNGQAYYPENGDTDYPLGYSASNPDVAVPAFLNTYGNSEVNSIDALFGDGLFDFKSMLKTVRPSWSVKYDGLKEFDFVKKYFRNIAINHRYTSNFTMGSYSSNVQYYSYKTDQTVSEGWATGEVNDSLFVSKYNISSFSATEQFMPLIGIDLTWKNNVLTKFEYKKTRNLTMSLVNSQMTEVYTWEYVFGTGYRFDQLKLRINNKDVKSDLNVRLDVGIRNNLSILYQLDEAIAPIPNQGQRVITAKFTADYKLSDNLTMQAYYDYNRTNPWVGSFLTAQTEFGFLFRFSLSNLK